MREMQYAASGQDIFMPWTYPPSFNLIVALFPFGPRGLSYAVFISLTFVGYVLVLHRLAGPNLTAVLIAVFPTMIVTMRTGQNGFLTGLLVGLFCLAFLRNQNRAGLSLGLMVIKPHLALGLGVLVLATQRWKVLFLGLGVVAAVLVLATLTFGTEVWPAFLGSIPEAKENLSKGLYPLFRMTSVYAALFTLDASPETAMIAQAFVAVAACIAIAMASLKGMPQHHVLALSCLATLAVSPYNYDYDMPILGVGLAIVAADLTAQARPIEKLALLYLSWLACGWGMLIATVFLTEETADAWREYPSLGAVGHLLLGALVWRILYRKVQSERTLPAPL
jgi:hypothetical protein